MFEDNSILIPDGIGAIRGRLPGDRLGKFGSFGLAASATLALTIAAFVQSFHAARLGVVLVVLLLVHMVRFARVLVAREAIIYACFLGYMLLELLWTADHQLALNTLVPAADFVIIIILFSSLARFHDFKSVMAGVVCGFVVGAAIYTSISGFPFEYPDEFSYNAIAGMYLFGLVATLLLASMTRRPGVLLVLSALIAVHIVATTSIKTNLGILLGALVVATVHFRQVSRIVWRHSLVIAIVAIAVGFAVSSNEAAVDTLRRGGDRIALGIQILQAREDLPGYSGFERRTRWQREGFRGWTENPVYGHGVEAFRSKFGMTSHASHVDIAYNSGLIGLALFYGVLASVFLRLYHSRHGGFRVTRMIVLGGLSCSLFISFAGTIHYGAFLAAFLALAIGILKRA